MPETPETKKPGFFQRLKEKLSKTTTALVDRVKSAIRLSGKVDEALLSELEQILIESDVGPETAMHLTDSIRKRKEARGSVSSDEVMDLFKTELIQQLGGREQPMIFAGEKPFIVLVVGVNGTGKTTTIGKIAQTLTQDGKKVMLVAGDTFRAAAIEQLEIWAQRTGSRIVKHGPGSDPGAVCFDALEAAKAESFDVVLIDTAGRLHTKTHLMEELKKVVRVIKKVMPGAPHETLLVLDATTGQNALQQARTFREAVDVTGLAMTKLDGTAKGGILAAIHAELKVPIRMIGIGESADDHRIFSPKDFVEALFAE